MRKGLLGSIAALAAGAGSAWGQSPTAPADPLPPAAIGPAMTDPEVVPVNGPPAPTLMNGVGGANRPLLPPVIRNMVGVNSPPAPVIMPPVAYGPPGDPQGLGPVGGFGPPPGPMYPNPGPYAAPTWQPANPGLGNAMNRIPAGTPGAAPHVWFSGDYLVYFTKAQPIRFPLVTTSAPSDQGLLGRPSTLVLLGQGDLGYNAMSGFRVTGGFFGDADRRKGLEVSGFMTEQKSNINQFLSSPTGIPTLARPFLDTGTQGAVSSLVIANPGLGGGGINVATSTQTFGVEANGVWNIFRSEPGSVKGCSIDFLAGYRFLQVKESLTIDTKTDLNLRPTLYNTFGTGAFGVPTLLSSVLVPGSVPFGGVRVLNQASILGQDRTLIYNNFNGGQVGLRGEAHYGMFVINMTGKFAIGNMHERIEMTGASGFMNPATGRIGTSYGGLFNNATNIATYNKDQFAVIPEVNANVGIHITRGLSAFMGYNFLYINRVARPGAQINPLIDTSSVPASPNYGATNRPSGYRMPINQDEFWLMGMNFGLRLQY